MTMDQNWIVISLSFLHCKCLFELEDYEKTKCICMHGWLGACELSYLINWYQFHSLISSVKGFLAMWTDFTVNNGNVPF